MASSAPSAPVSFRRRSFRLRKPERLAALLALGLLAFLLLAFNGGSWLALRYLRQLRESELETRLIAVGQTVAATLTPDNYLVLSFRTSDGALDVDLLRAYRDAPSYQDLLTQLRRAGEASGLTTITLVTADGRVVADPDEPERIGESWGLLPLDAREIQEAMQGRPATTPLYRIGEDLHKRAYIPVRDEKGSIIALLRLGASRDYLTALVRLQKTLTVMLLFSTTVVLLVAWVMYRLIGRVLAAERAMSQDDRLRSLGTLAAGLAHEIRNPLAIIRLTCEELRALGASETTSPDESSAARDVVGASASCSDPPSIPLINDIQDEVRRLETLVEQFLSFARLEDLRSTRAAGPPADALETTRRVLRLFEKSLSSDRVQITSDLPPYSPPRVVLDDKALEQTLLNVLRNAAEAVSDAPGTIYVSLADRQSRGVMVIVRDTGRGMTETVCRQAFDPFFSTKAGGTGLGLSLASQLLAAVGGHIEMDSAPGKGTEVRIYIPYSE
jgi:signal transduction histidine kinase